MRSLSWGPSSSSSAPRLIALPSSSEISPRTSLWAWRISIGLPPFAAGLMSRALRLEYDDVADPITEVPAPASASNDVMAAVDSAAKPG